MKNLIVETIRYNGSWVCPAEVTQIKVTAEKARDPSLGDHQNGNVTFLNHLGIAYAWGISTVGSSGLGDVTSRSSPVAVLGGLNFDMVRNQGLSTFGLANGRMYAWGSNTNGNLGVGDVTPRSSPVAVLGGLNFYDFVYKAGAGFALTAGGVAYAWGLNTNGNLGVGDVTPRSSPVAVLGGFKFSQIAADYNRSVIGLTIDGVAYGWGINPAGILGTGDVVPRSSPVAVLGGLTFSKVYCHQEAVFEGGSYGITEAGALYAWGPNTYGQLGVGNAIARSSPVAVLGGLVFDKNLVKPAFASVYACTLDGTMYSWGYGGGKGNLGTGTALPNASSPVAVLGGLKFKKFAIGYDSPSISLFVLALSTSGALYGWGSNPKGQLGVGDAVARSSPVAVLGGLTFVDVWTHNTSSFALDVNGVLYAWGDNASGELGLGDVTARSSPVAVLGGVFPSNFVEKESTILTVVPGTTYTLNMRPYGAVFGPNIVGRNRVDLIRIEYLG